MTAAEVVIGMRALLARLGTVDPRNQQELRREVGSFHRAMAKVSLVSSEATREKVAELTSGYGRVFVELMGLASACHKLKMNMEINRKLYEDANLERSRIVATIRESKESADEKYKLDALNNSFKNVQIQIDGLSHEFEDLGKKYHREIVRFGLLTYEKLAEFSDIQAEVTSLIRGEFGFDVNLERMKQEQRKQDEDARRTMQDLFDKLERDYYPGAG